eukprot:TRINITY_DN23488_c0_g1_i1.p2 TRINITY_DN23488_c0_g1~~TRINITY_DN23488_c0_g1_i1.p2  ORF type:complete len:106 (+),score=16.05 TRINITY_DN23488_c0_g1_i1:104-421(+)
MTSTFLKNRQRRLEEAMASRGPQGWRTIQVKSLGPNVSGCGWYDPLPPTFNPSAYIGHLEGTATLKDREQQLTRRSRSESSLVGTPAGSARSGSRAGIDNALRPR